MNVSSAPAPLSTPAAPLLIDAVLMMGGARSSQSKKGANLRSAPFFMSAARG